MGCMNEKEQCRPEMIELRMCNSHLFLLLKQHSSKGQYDGSAQKTNLS